MKAKIKYDVLTQEGKRRKISKVYEVPDFEEKRGVFLGHECVNTVEQQIDEFMNDIDKSGFMEENEIHIIFDWKVVSAVKKDNPKQELIIKPVRLSNDDMIKIFLGMWEMPERIKIDFAAIYTKMKKSLKGLSIERQIELVIASLGVAQKSSSAILDRLNEDMEEWRRSRETKQIGANETNL